MYMAHVFMSVVVIADSGFVNLGGVLYVVCLCM